MTQVYLVRAPNGFTIKDARGFNVAGGALGRSLPWPLPATTAGAVRTAIGEAAGWYTNPATANWQALLTDIEVSGPLAISRSIDAFNSWELLLPCPRDVLGLGNRRVWLAPTARAKVRGTWRGGRPIQDAATDALWWPRPTAKDKPHPLPPWWTRADALEWLLAPQAGPIPAPGPSPTGRVDMHLSLDAERATAQPGRLFGLETQETLVQRRRRYDELAFRIGVIDRRVGAPIPPVAPRVWRFGGEARVAEASLSQEDPWAFPSAEFEERWNPSRHFRLLVLSPAHFEHGWLPDGFAIGGTSAEFEKTFHLPTGPVIATLRAAYVGRPTPVSGWDFALGAPKASRLLVPQGAVYFLEARRPLTSEDARALWLSTLQRPGSPEARDGFGLVVPGMWPQ